MALLAQWVKQRPWLSSGIAGAAGGFAGVAGSLISSLSMLGISKAGIRTQYVEIEHPFRHQILRMLEHKPGLCYRELQAALGAANGTLRHHLDVLQTHRSVSMVEVNGRTCYFAGEPVQLEDLRGKFISLDEFAVRMPIGLSLLQKTIINEIKKNGAPLSQADLARKIGRSRASVHSAVKVLRRRGILRSDTLTISPHLIDTQNWTHERALDYIWDDERNWY